MSQSVIVIMDALSQIKAEKDTTLALMLEMQQRGISLYVATLDGIFWQHGHTWIRGQAISVQDDSAQWYQLGMPIEQAAHNYCAILFRKDPPCDMDYIYATYLLDTATQHGALVLNNPASVRAANEKLFTTWFPQCMPTTLITSDPASIKSFVKKEQHCIIKPLHGMGGHSIFQLKYNDPNMHVIIDTVTEGSSKLVMLQSYIPEIMHTGDKRIFIIDGKAVDYAIARIPAQDDFRGNLAQGARARGVPLSERDHWLCQQVGPTLKAKGLWLVGLDVIGDYITEINVTSPTCMRELDLQFDLGVASLCIDSLLEKIKHHHQ